MKIKNKVTNVKNVKILKQAEIFFIDDQNVSTSNNVSPREVIPSKFSFVSTSKKIQIIEENFCHT